MQRVVLSIANEFLHRAIRILDAVVHSPGVDVGAERVVQEVDRAIDVALGVLQQVGHLRADQGSDRHDEDENRRDHTEQNDKRRATAGPATTGQPRHSGFDGQGQEQRHQQQDEQREQTVVRVANEDRGQESEPKDDDGFPDPARHLRGVRIELDSAGLLTIRHVTSVLIRTEQSTAGDGTMKP